MKSCFKVTAALMALVAAAAFMPGCEDSALTAPADGSFIVTASPQSIVIDEPAGETEGRSVITVQLFDSSNFPMEGVSITFTTTGGTLALTEGGEVVQPPVTVVTDSSGVAAVWLTLALEDDTSVEVTARSGTLTSSIQVEKTVTAGNLQPEAYITAVPVDAQRVNIPVNFSGLNSIDPDEDDITCYKWTITSSIPAEDKVIQGHSRVSITERYDQEQILNVTLHVSDDPDYITFCDECEGTPAACGANDANFSPYFDTLDPQYQIVCDLTDPIALAGSDQIVTLTGLEVQVFLDGNNSYDDESVTLDFEWDCGNGTTNQNTAVADCRYSATGIYVATLYVTNVCQMTATDTVRVTVNEP